MFECVVANLSFTQPLFFSQCGRLTTVTLNLTLFCVLCMCVRVCVCVQGLIASLIQSLMMV